MNSKQKRSSGGYGLRRKVIKKRLDEDFEYYYSKIGTHLETSSKPIKEHKIHTHLVMVTEIVDSGNKTEMKINESPEKRPRGRPKKVQHNENQDIDFTDSALKLVELKDKRTERFRTDYLDDMETTKAVDEICPKNDAVMTIACKEDVKYIDCLVKRVKVESVMSGDDLTGLQEEEVSSMPEGEKENLPEEGIHLEPESDPEEGIEMQMDVIHGDIVERAIYEEEVQDKDSALLKLKRKYKRGRLSQDAIQKLSQLSGDDKIECSECHKLLKPSSFRQHLRTHTGEKPFGCEVCEARFTRKGDVERHVRIVHNKQKPFKCCRCQRAFGDKKNLRWHLMNHDKKLFYVCEVCGFKFGKREYWENHVRFIHPVPGGLDLDESNIGDESEDRLKTLTKTLLGEDESAVDDPSQDCAAAVNSIQNKEPIIEDPNSTEVSLSFINKGSNSEGLKIINVKQLNLPSLMKIGRPKITANLESFAQVVNDNDGGEIEAVVIEFDGSSSGSNTLQPVQSISSSYHQDIAPNVIHVVNSDNMLQLVETENHHSIVIESQGFGESTVNETETNAVLDCPTDVIQEQVVEVTSGSDGDQATVHYVNEGDEGSSKVISIMLTDDGGTAGNTSNTSVQTLIEALLVAAKGDSQNNNL